MTNSWWFKICVYYNSENFGKKYQFLSAVTKCIIQIRSISSSLVHFQDKIKIIRNDKILKTNPKEWWVSLSIESHCKIVWLRPQYLHDILIELGLFFLLKKTGRRKACVIYGQEFQICVQEYFQVMAMSSAECWAQGEMKKTNKNSVYLQGQYLT